MMIKFTYYNDTNESSLSYPYPWFKYHKPLSFDKIQYNNIRNYEYFYIVQNILFQAIMTLFKAEDAISWYNHIGHSFILLYITSKNLYTYILDIFMGIHIWYTRWALGIVLKDIAIKYQSGWG